MTIDIKKFIAERVRPHLNQSCPGLTYSDCEETISEDLEAFVRNVRQDTLDTLVSILRKQPADDAEGKLLHLVASEMEKMADYAVWVKEADKFLKEAVGDTPVTSLSEAKAIAAAHPLQTRRFDLHNEAMRLVGERHAKGDLVDLVNWLLLRIEEKKLA